MYEGDVYAFLDDLKRQLDLRRKWHEEFEARKKEYIDAVVKHAKELCNADQDCAFLLKEDQKRFWARQKVEAAQNKAMEELGYEG